MGKRKAFIENIDRASSGRKVLCGCLGWRCYSTSAVHMPKFQADGCKTFPEMPLATKLF